MGGVHSGGYIAGIILETESYGRTQRREGFSAVRQLTRVREHTEGGGGREPRQGHGSPRSQGSGVRGRKSATDPGKIVGEEKIVSSSSSSWRGFTFS